MMSCTLEILYSARRAGRWDKVLGRAGWKSAGILYLAASEGKAHLMSYLSVLQERKAWYTRGSSNFRVVWDICRRGSMGTELELAKR